jgi:putative Mn2+ efflux pump MntP
MSLLEILLVAVALAMDALAVSVAAGTTGAAREWRAVARMACFFGIFQGVMPVLGWLGGVHLVSVIAPVDHWVAFVLLGVVGSHMIGSSVRSDVEARDDEPNPSRGWALLVLSVATSIDALAVGLTFGVLALPIWYPALVIGVVTAMLSAAGARLGHYLGARFGRRMELLGGVVLWAIGIRILVTHLTG